MRKDKPYLALYIQDLLTDERLINCSASSHGVFLRLLCILHKQETYGKILLKQKHKQTDKQIKNFALYISKQMPFSESEILAGLTELLEEGVITIDADFLFQKRMVNDYELSLKRSISGKEGGKKTQLKTKNFAKAKVEANTDIDIDNDIEDDNVIVFENEKLKFANDFRWKEKFCRDKNLSMPELEKRMAEFISDIELREDFKELKELKSHFTNTFNKQKNGHKTNQTGGKHSGALQLIESLKQDFAAGRT
jgi:hypothetical protein